MKVAIAKKQILAVIKRKLKPFQGQCIKTNPSLSLNDAAIIEHFQNEINAMQRRIDGLKGEVS